MNRKFIKRIFNPLKSLIPDKTYLQLQYKAHLNRRLNLNNPSTFSEKIQWLKLNYRQPNYVELVDKYTVRNYIKEKIGEKYLIPLLGVYDKVEDIDWGKLPNEFILKCTHGSHCNIICIDKTQLNIKLAKQDLKKWMKRNWYWYGREWPYKYIKPKIICEKLLVESNNSTLTDYKFYCFNGEPLYCQVIRGRNEKQTIDFYDDKWIKMEFNGLQKNATNSLENYSKPNEYEEMLKLAKILAQDHKFVRVDLYYTNSKIYFGELTFYPLSGLGEFSPKEWNYKLGDLIQLPPRKKFK